MIYLVGDTHATLDISKLSELQKNSYREGFYYCARRFWATWI